MRIDFAVSYALGLAVSVISKVPLLRPDSIITILDQLCVLLEYL